MTIPLGFVSWLQNQFHLAIKINCKHQRGENETLQVSARPGFQVD